MRYNRRVGRGLQLASGRVIALGRLLFATLFLAVIWLETSQPGQFATQAYSLLVGYVLLAAGLVIATWNNWWLDAHLAGPAHAIDIALFTALVYLTEGDKSPFFTFFMFLLLSAAIRWGWRATALTALLLTILYVGAGFVALTPRGPFELDRFVARTGYLVILSLILIWFGVNQWRARVKGPAEELMADPAVDKTPLENSLRAAMAAADASAGAIVWTKDATTNATAIVVRGGEVAVSKLEPLAAAPRGTRLFLYDLPNQRALMRDADSNLRQFPIANHLPNEVAAALELREGLAIPVVGSRGTGQLYLEGVRALSTDHLELGEQIAAAVATHIQRQALMKAAEENAESRSRLALARDLHDSVVQFLAGAAFRLEAMKRAQEAGRDLAPELDELKQLMLQEQVELRSFIAALRSGSQMRLAELATDLQSLAKRLSRQWGVQCTFTLEPSDVLVSARLHVDAQQLVREAVANAVRHARARNVSIRLAADTDEVRLEFVNDGAAYPREEGGGRMPRSLRERVESAGGELELSRGMGVTKLSISLPAIGKAA